MFRRQLGIDLGTANTLVFVPGKGIVINEPSVVALSREDGSVLAVGLEAKSMLGRTPDEIIASRPLKNGVIADYRTTEAMLDYFINRAMGALHFLKPEIVISIPAGITGTEKRAVIEAATRVGARAVYVVKEPVLAALGAGINIDEPSGNMIVDIGGGTSEVAIMSLGGIVTAASVRVGGDRMDEVIADFIRKRHNLDIGLPSAEYLKITIGRALAQNKNEDSAMNIKGRDLIEGLPRLVEIKASELTQAIAEVLHEIIQAIKTVLQDTPPELSADVMDKGIVLSGGGALLKDFDLLITQVTGVPTRVADEPLLNVAKGTGFILNNLAFYKRTLLAKRATVYQQ